MDINDLRKEIDKIDDEMLKLFLERMDVVKEVALYKKENFLPITDKEREKTIKEKKSEKVEKEEIKKYYVNFLDDIINISKRYQNEILKGVKIAYAGKKGAFAYFGIKNYFGECEPVNFLDFKEAYEAVENGECEYAFLPIENNDAGEVGRVQDLLFSGSLYIVGIYEMPIDQTLIGIKGSNINDIKVVYSHPQALSQTNEYIINHNFKTIETNSTSDALDLVKEKNDKTLACIGCKDAATLYDLEVLDSKINEKRNNSTRFAIFSRVLTKNKINNNFIITFTVKNESGALAKALGIISSYDYNMRCIRSRPRKELMWSYYFYAEIIGDVFTKNGEEMLKALQTCCDNLKIAGVYSD